MDPSVPLFTWLYNTPTIDIDIRHKRHCWLSQYTQRLPTALWLAANMCRFSFIKQVQVLKLTFSVNWTCCEKFTPQYFSFSLSALSLSRGAEKPKHLLRVLYTKYYMLCNVLLLYNLFYSVCTNKIFVNQSQSTMQLFLNVILSS